MSNFRCSNYFLNIKICRRTSVALDLRFCRYCEDLEKYEAIQDEIHALFDRNFCPDLCLQYISPFAVLKRNREIEFSRLITTEDPEVLKNVANFVYFLIKRLRSYNPH